MIKQMVQSFICSFVQLEMCWTFLNDLLKVHTKSVAIVETKMFMTALGALNGPIVFA